ncbi:hypothetical protein LTR84_008417 [Exophiala bonariae]|uniref:Uncharacterized protein n=1 Tax=Exophiala bonariae TaxID=1690606 RepID=A0AAV9MYA8_9EURO|nr:hypothetical protein LTR84_008417 [Exophiala bonariae]
MKANKFLFVNSTGSVSEDVKERERARTQARSHAALASHALSRHQHEALANSALKYDGKENSPPSETSPRSSTTSSPEPTPKPLNIKFRLNVPGRKKAKPSVKFVSKKNGESDQKDSPRARPQLPSVSVLRPINKSSLDPFVRPATELSVPDQNLLHLYLTKMPQDTYGTTTAGPIAKSLHEGSMVGVERFEINLLWCLMGMETTLTSFQPTNSARQLSILSRRSKIYQLMRAEMNGLKPGADVVKMDNFMLIISMAATIEKRMGNTHQADLHTKALKDFLLMKGGITAIKNMVYPQNLMIVNALIEIGLQGLYDSREYLLRRLVTIMERLRQLQEWNHTLRERQRARAPSNAMRTGREFLGDQDLPGLDYLDRRTRAFHKPALFEYIELPLGKPTPEEYKFYLSMLFAINSAMYAFRHSESTSSTYLRVLIECTESSNESSNFILQCFGAKLPCLLLLIMLAHYAADSEGRDEFTKAVFDVEEVYEFVELMMMASPDSRDVVLKIMWSWLASPDADGVGALSSAKFDIMADEIEDRWLADQIQLPSRRVGS